jgi:hypothetical protein
MAKIIEFPRKTTAQRRLEAVLSRSGDIPEQLRKELVLYAEVRMQKFNALRSGFTLVLPDTFSETDTAFISVAAQDSVDSLFDKSREIFKEMLREILLLRLALFKSQQRLP